MNPQRRLLKPRDVAEMFDVPVETLRNWRYLGRGPRWTKVEGQVRYRQSDIDAYIDARTSDPAAV